jgi:hypothetical protein
MWVRDDAAGQVASERARMAAKIEHRTLSGSAVILEIAEQMTKVNLRNKVRFMRFGAEERAARLGCLRGGPQQRGAGTDRRDVEL